jgi:hypothetical protein
LYRDRANLERDYAAKLQLLAKKAAEKKSRMEASMVVGEDPTKAWNTNTLKQRYRFSSNFPSVWLMGHLSSTLYAVYDEVMHSMVSAAQDHVNIADALISQVVEVLKSIGKKNEESRKKVLLDSCNYSENSS